MLSITVGAEYTCRLLLIKKLKLGCGSGDLSNALQRGSNSEMHGGGVRLTIALAQGSKVRVGNFYFYLTWGNES